MNRDQFADLVRAFMSHAHPGRNLYVWYGGEPELVALLPQSAVHRFAIYDSLSGLSDIPFADEDARYQLKQLVRQTLEALAVQDHGDPQILVVTGAALLARYGGADVFFNFVNDHRLVILQVSSETIDADTLGHLPGYAQFEPAVELEILKHILERPENLITEEQ